jgi:hypothetical protein
MGFIANFKAKRAAKKAQAIYELEQYEWERENSVLNAALDIFTSASKGEEPNESSLSFSSYLCHEVGLDSALRINSAVLLMTIS